MSEVIGIYRPELHYSKWLGGKVRAVKEGELTMFYFVREEMSNPLGIVHGGVLSSIADNVMASVVYTFKEERYFYVTLNLNIDYISNTPVNDEIYAKAKLNGKGMNQANVSCEIFNKENKLLARASANLLRTSRKVDPNEMLIQDK